MASAGQAGEVRVDREVRIPCGEAGSLAATLYLPAGTGPFPALVTVVPYRKDGAAGVFYGPSLHWFAERGYAGLLVDFLGTGSSDGPQRPPFDPGEADDGVAAVEWAARQTWSSGKVGMWGHSYGAIMAMRTAARHPPHLAAIAPVMGALDPERDFVHPAGARGCLGSVASWGLQTLASQLLPPLSGYGTAADQARWQQRARDAEPWLLDLIRHGPGDPAWRSRVIDATAITVPSYCIAGWRDLFCDAAIRAYEQIDAPKKLLVGPWLHTMPEAAQHEPVDFRVLALRWWDQWLRGADNGLAGEPPVTLYIQGAARPWHHFSTWPPSAADLRYATASDTALTQKERPGAPGQNAGQPPAAPAAPVIAQQRPDPTVGSLGGLWSMPSAGFGYPLDQHDDDLRAISCTSGPLAHDIVIAGRPSAAVRLSGPAPGRLVARLADVDADGRSILISAGVISPPDAGALHTVGLGPTAYRLRAGHRLRVVLGDADFPRLWPASSREAGMLAVESVELSLPVLTDGGGVPAEPPPPPAIPAPAAAGAGGYLRPIWTITRDLVSDAVEVVLGAELRATVPAGVSYREERAVAARAGQDEPARVHGTQTVTAKLPTGENIVVTAELHLSDAGGTVRAHVSAGAATLITRAWEA
jgi:putative CocE/NonD family hydrolase